VGSSARRLIGALSALGGAVALTAAGIGAPPNADRTISFFHIHTKETLTVLYKKDGAYIPEALKKINRIMRDWRKNEEIEIDPKAIDIIWEMHEELGSREPVHIICGYRSRDTNEKLRKTVGGQASQSQHITGKALDVSFPDVPVRQMRYSALVRERGGVGYYPTSAIPFVHVDTGRVRHWPRMGRDELALLFPSGHSKHEPADGGPIKPSDVTAARERKKDLAIEVAQYFHVRDTPKGLIAVADAGGVAPLAAPKPKPATRPSAPADGRMAVGAPTPEVQLASAPKLVGEPRMIERPSQFTTRQTESDRARLDMLATLASLDEVETPRAASTGSKPPVPVYASLGPLALPAAPLPKPQQGEWSTETKTAVLEPELSSRSSEDRALTTGSVKDDSAWSAAPAFDEEHPDELSYRPFPLAPLLTASASPDDPALAKMVHPDAAKTLELIDDEGRIPPMRFRPGEQVARLLWAHEFRGDAVSLAELEAADERPATVAAGLSERQVKTLPR
jgi:uncharacterized protein YcbK (DUF882 family)